MGAHPGFHHPSLQAQPPRGRAVLGRMPGSRDPRHAARDSRSVSRNGPPAKARARVLPAELVARDVRGTRPDAQVLPSAGGRSRRAGPGARTRKDAGLDCALGGRRAHGRGSHSHMFALNPNRRVEVVEVGRERSAVICLDDFSVNPDELIGLACSAPFIDPGGYYPGVRAPAPEEYTLALL